MLLRVLISEDTETCVCVCVRGYIVHLLNNICPQKIHKLQFLNTLKFNHVCTCNLE